MKALRRIGWVAASLFLIAGEASAQPATLYSANPSLRLPVRLEEGVKQRMAEIKLYVRGKDGDWQCLATVPADKTSLDCTLPGDGSYALLFVLVDRNGKNYPSSLSGAIPQRMVVIDSVKPEVEVKPVNAANGETYLQAAMKDANPDPKGIDLAYQLPDGTWRKLEPLGADSPNTFRVGDPGILKANLRATLRDLAGNTNTCDITAGGTKPALPELEPAKTERRAEKPAEPLLPAIVSDSRPPIQQIGFETRDVRSPAWPKPLPLSMDLPDAPLTFEVATQVLKKQVEKAAAEVPDDFGQARKPEPAKLPELPKAEPAKLPELPDLVPLKTEEPKKQEPVKGIELPELSSIKPDLEAREPGKGGLRDLLPKKVEETKLPESVKSIELPDLLPKKVEEAKKPAAAAPAAKVPSLDLPDMKALEGPSIGTPDLALPPVGGVPATLTARTKPADAGPSIGVPELEMPTLKPAHHVESKPADMPVQKLTSRRMTLEYQAPANANARPDYWVSADGMKTWKPLAAENSKGEGLSFTLPGEGIFAIRIRPLGGKQPPASGERPDCMVEVKLPNGTK